MKRVLCWFLRKISDRESWFSKETCGLMTRRLKLGEGLKFDLSPDVVLCGRLGSKHEVTN